MSARLARATPLAAVLLLPIPIAWVLSSSAVTDRFDLCPTLGLFASAEQLRITALRIGQNRTSAQTIRLKPSRWFWRPKLADEPTLKLLESYHEHIVPPFLTYDEHGRPVRCATDLPEGSRIVYIGVDGLPWQWAPEAVGHVRHVEMRPVELGFIDGPPGTPESDLELRARLADRTDDDGGDGGGDGGGGVGAAGQPQPPLRTVVELETLSTSPPIFRVRNLVPASLLDALAVYAAPSFTPSTVGDPSLPVQGGRKVDDRRTSSSSWLHGFNDPRKTLPAARAVQRGVASLLRLTPPADRLLTSVEPLLCVRYDEGQFYEPHHDFFAGDPSATLPAEAAFAPPKGSNRYATVVVYIEEPFEGGETIFPFSAQTSNASDALDGVSFAGAEEAPSCDFPTLKQRRGLMVTPKRGDALLFYDQLPSGALDGRTRHGSCPVVKGRKTAANVWSWNREAIYR